jgi:uncharacterized membrane protein
MNTATGSRPGLEAQLARWTSAGLLSADQADRIREWESRRESAAESTADAVTRPPPAARRSLAVEGLAYVGGVIILAAVILVLAGSWHTLSTATRIALMASGTMALLLAGSLLSQRWGQFADRLRGVLWLLSTAGLTGLLILVVDGADLSGERSILMVSLGSVVYSAGLWLLHRSTAQHVAAFGAAEFLAVGIALQIPDQDGQAVGVAMVAIGVLWGVLARIRLLPGTSASRLPPGGTPAAGGPELWHQRLGLALAAVGSAIGAIILGIQPEQPWLGAVAIALVVAVAIALGDLAVLSVGSVGTLIVLPVLVGHYFASTIAVALVLLGAGALLVVLAVLVARRRHRKTGPAGDRPAV